MKNQLANAMALALVVSVAGLSSAPLVSAGHEDCHEDFEIADSEAAASNRGLDPSEMEIGLEDVVSGTGETLHIALRSPLDELHVQVFLDDGCEDVTDDRCGDSTVILTGLNEEATCDLKADATQDYFVEFSNAQSTDGLVYETWSTTP